LKGRFIIGLTTTQDLNKNDEYGKVNPHLFIELQSILRPYD
jgi:energy-converting hydrogenase Eha subunit F